MKKFGLLLAATLLASACASQGDSQPASAAAAAPAATAESASQAIAAAEASAKQADAVGFQWRDTEELIAKAKEAAAKKDFATAQKLANQAEMQGQLAVKQQQREDTAYKTSASK